MHICFVCSELPPAPTGGIGACVCSTSAALAQLGHEVTVIGNYDKEYDWAIPGVRVIPLIHQKWCHYPGHARLKLLSSLNKLHKQHHVSIIEWPDYQGLYLKPLAGVCGVLRNHGGYISHRMDGLVPKKTITEYFELRTMSKLKYWIGVSNWFMQRWIKISHASPKIAQVIYNPVDCNLFRPPANKQQSGLILYAGNLIERKGVYSLAKAAREFLPKLPESRLLFVGRDSTGKAINRIRELIGPSSKRVDFSGPLSQGDLAKLMREADVFAMPSLLESFGNVWAEAMAAGLPVVGSNLTVGPEVVPEGQCGLLPNPQEPEQVAQAVLRLMRDPDLRKTMGHNGRKHALEHYEINSCLKQLLQFYESCLQFEAKGLFSQ